MSERRFYLRELLESEWNNPMAKSNYLITESELRKRLDIINGTIGPPSRWIDILLHGSGENGPKDNSGGRGSVDYLNGAYSSSSGTSKAARSPRKERGE